MNHYSSLLTAKETSGNFKFCSLPLGDRLTAFTSSGRPELGCVGHASASGAQASPFPPAREQGHHRGDRSAALLGRVVAVLGRSQVGPASRTLCRRSALRRCLCGTAGPVVHHLAFHHACLSFLGRVLHEEVHACHREARIAAAVLGTQARSSCLFASPHGACHWVEGSSPGVARSRDQARSPSGVGTCRCCRSQDRLWCEPAERGEPPPSSCARTLRSRPEQVSNLWPHQS